MNELFKPQIQPCAGRSCGSTNPNLHSAECFEDYEKTTGMAQQQEPVANVWEQFAGYLIDKCEGEIISEEGLQRALADMLADPAYTRPQAREPLTDAMVVEAARMLSDRQAAACNVDCGDMWKMHGNEFIDDARAALEAAHGIKE